MTDIVSINILTLPADGGAAITDLEYRVNAGAAVSLGETTTGSYPITADDGDDIQVRAVNAVGAGDWSDVKAVPAGETFDPDALAYITAVETADGEPLESGVKDAINDFVVGCKADAIWDALKASCILAGARTLNGCLVPLVGSAPTNINFVSADYNRKTGLKGNGTNKYLNSNRNNNADPQDSQHLAAWVAEQTDITGDSTHVYVAGNLSGSSQLGRSGAGARVLRAISRRQGVSVGGPEAAVGFAGVSRSGSDTAIGRVTNENFVIEGESETPASEVLTIFSAGGVSGFAEQRISFYSIGGSIDLAALDARVSTLMTALDGAIT